MKKLTLINCVIIATFFIFSAIEAFSQTDFYYSRGKKIPIIVSSDAVVIKFKDVKTEYAANKIISTENMVKDIKPISVPQAEKFFKASLKPKTDVKQLIDRLKKKTEVEIVNYVYIVDGLEAVPYDQFSIQFKPSVNREQVEALNKLHNVEIIEMNVSVPNLFRLRVTETSDLSVVDMAKLYYESLPAEWSVPDFFMPVQLYTPNDTYFTNQYYLHNTDQTGGVTDADIDAIEAWNVSTGSSSITVAVIDEGGSSHEDLPTNRIVAGYDYCYLDTDPSPGGNQAHGMACAGVIAATQNNSLGVTGVAPNCKVMPVRIFDDYGSGASNANIANAIDFAWQNGAHVLSNSWGYGSSNPNLVPEVVDAINRALTQGRGGKGCVVVFAAGNTANRSSGYYGYVSFPACVPGVIAVGATDKSNNIQFYSPRDNELAVVAPSGDLGYGQGWFDCSGEDHYRIELRGDVWSMDIGGQPGWNDGQYGICPPTNYNEFVWQSPGGDAYPPGNYTSHFGGTSAACPQASGIASLILSLNPDLTQTQVAYIIKQTADDMGATGWDNDYGYGRVNAYKALKYTLEHYGGTLTHSLTIPSGEAWIFQPGVTVKFPSGYSLIVNGTLNVQGTSSDRVTFTRSGTSGTWGGIKYYSGSSGSIQYADINNAYVGVYANNSSPTVSYTTINNCTYGVRPYASNITVSNSTISNCSYGVYAYSGYPDINNCTISNCSYGAYLNNSNAGITSNEITGCTRGVYGYYADYTDIVNNLITTGWSTRIAGVQLYDTNEPNLYNNTINGYSTYLLDADHYSRPMAIGPGSQNYQGYNRMTDGVTANIYAHDHSEVVFGTGFLGSSEGYAGYNTIYTDIGEDKIAHVRAENYSNIIAQHNYWGEYPPQDFYNDGTSSIDYRDALSSDPGGGSSLGKSLGDLIAGTLTTCDYAFSDIEAVETLWQEANEHWQNLCYRKALQKYQTLLQNYLESPYAPAALLRVAFAYRSLKDDGLEEYLQNFAKSTDQTLRTEALELLIGEDIRHKRTENAIEKAQQVISENPDTEAEYKALFTLFNLYATDLEDQKNALAVLDQMKAKYTDYSLTQMAQFEMGEPVEWLLPKPIEFGKEPETVSATPLTYRLATNYPNPFNPVTRIDFELPEEALVTLKVYDLLGREIRNLVNGHVESGHRQIMWDGRDDAGEILPNGVYIYVLRANDFKSTRKMILLK